MAFPKKTWTDRVSEQPQRRLLTPTGGGTAMTVDVTRQEGIVIQEGDAFSAANMNDLENRIKTNFDSDEATMNTINNRSTTNANNISTLQGNVSTLSTNLTSVTSRVGTLENEFTANGKRLYMDYKNGKYGYNTSANRGADTFFPFSSLDPVIVVNETTEDTSKTYNVIKGRHYYICISGGSALSTRPTFIGFSKYSTTERWIFFAPEPNPISFELFSVIGEATGNTITINMPKNEWIHGPADVYIVQLD